MRVLTKGKQHANKSAFIRNLYWAYLWIHFLSINQSINQLASPLDFSVGRGALGEATTSDGINLVHKDDTWLVVAGVGKHLTDQPNGHNYKR